MLRRQEGHAGSPCFCKQRQKPEKATLRKSPVCQCRGAHGGHVVSRLWRPLAHMLFL